MDIWQTAAVVRLALPTGDGHLADTMPQPAGVVRGLWTTRGQLVDKSWTASMEAFGIPRLVQRMREDGVSQS
jgi:hypothetical protein